MQLFKLTGLLFSLTVTACGGGSSTPAGASTAPKATARAGDAMCPVAVPGTSVTVEDTVNGAALVFVTTGDVAEVRRSAAAMAQMHNEHHASMGALPNGSDAAGGEHAGHDTSGGAGHGASGGGHAGHDTGGQGGHDMGHGGHDMEHAGHDMGHGGHDMGGHGDMMGVHSKATASDIEGGAKITFVVIAEDVAKLQSELRMHAQHMAAGTCAMGK